MNMDVYGGMGDIGVSDLKELWDTELDTMNEPLLRLSSDSDINDWFMERGSGGDHKISHVILNDKLMTDALFGTIPIKAEHSYSLTSDGDSMPESPHDESNKMDDLDDNSNPMLTSSYGTISDNNNNNTTVPTQHTTTTVKQKKFLHLLSASCNNNNNNTTSISNQNFFSHSPSKQQHNNSSNNQQQQSIDYSTKYYHGSSNPKSYSPATESSMSSLSDIEIDDATVVKEEPLSPHSSCPPSPKSLKNYSNERMQHSDMFEHKTSSHLSSSSSSHSLLKAQQHFGTTSPSTSNTSTRFLKSNVKLEPQLSNFGLPPTPPSSLPSDESEGNQSPEHHLAPMSPSTLTTVSTSSKKCQQQFNGNNSAAATARGYSNSTRQPIHTPLISSQPKGSTGELILTDEEKRTLLAEGYPIPQRLPLTKAEEKSLKKVRRKIKNKISAQESRRKKKEYMDQLERRVEKLVMENNSFRMRVETLSDENSSLMKELQRLQQLVQRQQGNANRKA